MENDPHQSIDDCIEESTVNRSDLIHDVFMGWNGSRESMLGQEDLIKEGLAILGSSPPAKFFTIDVGKRVGPDFNKDQLFIELHLHRNYKIFIHDP